MANNSDYTTVIKPHAGLFNLKLREVWAYRDLVFILARRDIVAVYKQTILGPLWFLVSPVLTVVVYMFVFGSIAGISTDGMPQAVFYLGGITLWNYFSSCFTATANTFTANAQIFGKVYFPRIVAPMANVLSNMVKLFIQMLLFVGVLAFYLGQNDSTIQLTEEIYLLPVLILMMAGLSLGIGIIISSLTTKYRDFKNFIGFGVSLLMYASPVIYPISAVKDKGYGALLAYNPIAPIIETFRYIFTGHGSLDWGGLMISGIATISILFFGLVLFNRVERTFMDTV
ncbi:MAG: ABC transporter permease [Saprospirales bacterium]|nr:ABC transporter permease [Saprospirales bacterium]|tara:strand:- start:2190 stop:3044 length:855 start_codon:yes stop_codon:yes gene_type:complete